MVARAVPSPGPWSSKPRPRAGASIPSAPTTSPLRTRSTLSGSGKMGGSVPDSPRRSTSSSTSPRRGPHRLPPQPRGLRLPGILHPGPRLPRILHGCLRFLLRNGRTPRPGEDRQGPRGQVGPLPEQEKRRIGALTAVSHASWALYPLLGRRKTSTPRAPHSAHIRGTPSPSREWVVPSRIRIALNNLGPHLLGEVIDAILSTMPDHPGPHHRRPYTR